MGEAPGRFADEPMGETSGRVTDEPMGEAPGRLAVVVMETGGWGGLHYYAHALCNALSRYPVELVLLTNEEYELEDRPHPFERVRRFRREGYLRTLSWLVPLLWRRRPRVLHIQSLLAPRKDLVLFLVCRLLGIRVVLTVHNVLPHEVRSLERVFHFLYYRLADGLILHSQANRQCLLGYLPNLDPERLWVIPHGNYTAFSDLELSRSAARQRLGLPAAGRIALFFGAIRPYKGLDLLLRTVVPVQRACAEAVFVVAGQVLTGEQAQYERQMAGLGADPERLVVRFAYLSTADAIAYVCAADLVVLPYREIYQSGVLFWAYSFGRPVLATRVGAFPESVEEGRTGWLVDREDVDGMQNALIRLLRQPEELAAAGERARQVARERYDWHDIARETAQVYAQVAAR
jgi:glycosyltransferase involved in cell wall biosynthesis